MAITELKQPVPVLPEPPEVYDAAYVRQLIQVIERHFSGIETATPSDIELRRYALMVGGATADGVSPTSNLLSPTHIIDLDDVLSSMTPTDTQVLTYDSINEWQAETIAYANISGTPTLATVATTGAYSDLTGTPAGTSFLTITEFDGDDASNYYYGGVDSGGDWQINQYDRTTFVLASADEIGNGAYTTLSAAWAVRTGLIYS